VESVVWDVFVEDNVPGVKEMIGSKRTNTITMTAGRIAHKEALAGFGT
jgi:hypothetical protein